MLTCQLPSGAGADQAIVVSANRQFSPVTSYTFIYHHQSILIVLYVYVMVATYTYQHTI
jgi:hypothetical protein